MAAYGSAKEMEQVLARMAELMASDAALIEAGRRTNVTIGYELRDLGVFFYTRVMDGSVEAGLGELAIADMRVVMTSGVFDGIFTGTINPASAFAMGQLSFSGNMTAGMRLQGLLKDIGRVYRQAKADCLAAGK